MLPFIVCGLILWLCVVLIIGLPAAGSADASITAPSASRLPQWLMAVALLAFSAGVYLYLGNPTGHGTPMFPKAKLDEINRGIHDLEKSLQAQPDNHDAWVLLAKTYAAIGRYAEAGRAYQHGLPSVEKNAELLAEFAATITSAQAGRASGRPMELLQQAINLQPDNLDIRWQFALALEGENDFAAAAQHYQFMMEHLPPDSPEYRNVRQAWEDAQGRMNLSR